MDAVLGALLLGSPAFTQVHLSGNCGTETMYPEYRSPITGPVVCTRDCRCTGIQGAVCPLKGTGS